MILASVVASMLGACAPGAPPVDRRLLGPAGEPADESARELVHQSAELQFTGGQIDIELYRTGHRIVQVARNRYAVPIVLNWHNHTFDNLEPNSLQSGVTFLPAASEPMGYAEGFPIAELYQLDLGRAFTRQFRFTARFGDPRAVPRPYAYALPYPRGRSYSVLQGFRGPFSHRGSNEFAVDFDCPVATPVLAAREGTIVAVHASARGAGTTPEYHDYRRTNFVLVLHDDGTIGEYLHLAPSTVHVRPGQRVARLEELALSGNTGYSSTPHLHFQVMTAAQDGVSATSFPFEIAVGPGRVEPPVQGQKYPAWETH